MILSKERLLKEKQISGYRQEIIEKVIWLMEILNAIADDSYLTTRLALKGGTALNLVLSHKEPPLAILLKKHIGDGVE